MNARGDNETGYGTVVEEVATIYHVGQSKTAALYSDSQRKLTREYQL